MTDEEKKRIQDAIQVIRNRANEICSIVNLKMKEEFTLLWDKFLEENREKIRVTAFANFLPQKRIFIGSEVFLRVVHVFGVCPIPYLNSF